MQKINPQKSNNNIVNDVPFSRQAYSAKKQKMKNISMPKSRRVSFSCSRSRRYPIQSHLLSFNQKNKYITIPNTIYTKTAIVSLIHLKKLFCHFNFSFNVNKNNNREQLLELSHSSDV